MAKKVFLNFNRTISRLEHKNAAHFIRLLSIWVTIETDSKNECHAALMTNLASTAIDTHIFVVQMWNVLFFIDF